MGRATIGASIQPTQRAVLQYGGGAVPSAAWNKSSLVIPGRGQYGNGGLNEANAAGALCILYHNNSVYVNSGLYHNWMYSTSSGLPALSAYGSGGTTYGPPINWLALTTNQIRAKYDSTVRKMKSELPWLKGLFLDDTGPDWAGYSTLSASVQEQFYQVHVVIATKLAELAEELGLFLLSNGEWRGDKQHGYPARGTYGCSLYDGFCIEHHDISQLSFWQAVASGQWRARDPNGQRLMYQITSSASQPGGGGDTTEAWRNRPHTAWITQATTPQYTANPAPVATQLPTHDLQITFGGAPAGTITLAPNPASVQTGATQQFTATVTGTSAVTTWTVNGVSGGAAATGTISGAGLYTAPASAPSGGVVTVGASNAAAISGFASVTVTQAAPPPPEAQLGAPPAPAVKAFGNRFAGILPNNMTPDFSRGVIVTAPEAGSVNRIVVGYDGGGPGTLSQQFKCRIYAMTAAGNVGTLLGSTAEYSVLDGDTPAWISLVMDTPVPVTADTDYLLAIHSGGTEATARFFRNDVSGVSRSIADAYVDGGVSPMTGAAAGNADISIFADYTPTGVSSTTIAGSIDMGLTFAGSAQNTASVGVTNVMYINLPITRTYAIPYEDLGDGVQGRLLRWSGTQFEYDT